MTRFPSSVYFSLFASLSGYHPVSGVPLWLLYNFLFQFSIYLVCFPLFYLGLPAPLQQSVVENSSGSGYVNPAAVQTRPEYLLPWALHTGVGAVHMSLPGTTTQHALPPLTTAGLYHNVSGGSAVAAADSQKISEHHRALTAVSSPVVETLFIPTCMYTVCISSLCVFAILYFIELKFYVSSKTKI